MATCLGLRGLTYSEFDNVVGPQLRFSFPPDVLPAAIFEPLSNFVIVGKHLAHKIILVKAGDLQFLNYSMSIDNSKYERNTLLFSFGFVLDRDVASEPYEPVLRKLSSVILSLEIEKEFLFQDAAKQKIQDILCSLYKGLRQRGEAFILLDEHNFLALKLFKPITPQPRKLSDWEVPILLYSKLFMSNLPWDISLQHLCPNIDGTRHIKRIAIEAQMDVDCVKQSLRILLFYECVIVVDVFRFSNVYQQCLDVSKALPADSSLLAQLEAFCAVDVAAPEAVAARGQRIIDLLSALRPGRTLAQVLCEPLPSSLPSPSPSPAPVPAAVSVVGIDLRRLLAIAQERGLVRRLHEYPVLGLMPRGLDDDQDDDDEDEEEEDEEDEDEEDDEDEAGYNNSGSSPSRRTLFSSYNVSSARGLFDVKTAGEADVQSRHLESLLDAQRLSELDGSLSLDAFCCKHEPLPPAAVLQHPLVHLVYK